MAPEAVLINYPSLLGDSHREVDVTQDYGCRLHLRRTRRYRKVAGRVMGRTAHERRLVCDGRSSVRKTPSVLIVRLPEHWCEVFLIVARLTRCYYYPRNPRGETCRTAPLVGDGFEQAHLSTIKFAVQRRTLPNARKRVCRN